MKPLKLHVVSDVHPEFQRWRREWDINAIECDIHVMAGDNGVGLMGLQFALKSLSKPAIVVAGNHEFYGRRTVAEWWRDARQKVEGTHVHLLENESVVIDGIRFLGTTLWTNFLLFGLDRQEEIGKYCAARMSDFERIYLSRKSTTKSVLDPFDSRTCLGTRLTWRVVAQWHQKAREFLERELPRRSDWDRTVVVTHHAPSINGIEDPGSPEHLDAAYASALDHLIPLADIWIHGHVHRADDYSGTQGGRIVRNARGYADTGFDAVPGFQWNRVITLE